MAEPNWANRTMWTGDNLDIMRGMNSESVDLIYLDPPFNSNRTYEAPIGSKAAGAAFKDTWTLSDVDVAWHGYLADKEPGLHSVIAAARQTHGKSMMYYLVMMGVRLLEMRRVLKETGSMYLHCDPTASHYLKLVMDAILGRDGFRNEIVWKRATAKKGSTRKFGAVHDIILYYVRGSGSTFNPIYLKHRPEYVAKAYRYEDEHGRFRVDNLTAAGSRTGSSGESWRDVELPPGKHWAVPATWPTTIQKPSGWDTLTTQEKLDYMDSVGLIYWPQMGNMPSFKRYLSAVKGTAMTDLVTDVSQLEGKDREKVGYPTQKPLALLERLIRAASNEGDMVLDPFCGCATACVAAEMLDRRWVGIDISHKAVELVAMRTRENMGLRHYEIANRTDIPQRTDQGKLPNYRTHKHELYGRQEGRCICGEHFPFHNFTVDHILARSKSGTDHIDNLMLLCGACNSLKGRGDLTNLIAGLKKQDINPNAP